MASWNLQLQPLEMLTAKSNASSASPIEHYVAIPFLHHILTYLNHAYISIARVNFDVLSGKMSLFADTIPFSFCS